MVRCRACPMHKVDSADRVGAGHAAPGQAAAPAAARTCALAFAPAVCGELCYKQRCRFSAWAASASFRASAPVCVSSAASGPTPRLLHRRIEGRDRRWQRLRYCKELFLEPIHFLSWYRARFSKGRIAVLYRNYMRESYKFLPASHHPVRAQGYANSPWGQR